MLKERLMRILKDNAKDLAEDLEEIIQEIIEKYNPLSIMITGSLAKGKFVRGLSDIDILVITKERPGKHNRFLLRAAKDVDVEITVYSIDEIRQAIRAGNQFVREALESGVEVYRSRERK